ncbi:reverse transcriptase/maturase family protein [uncultured Halomonas sp.]|uniref:reverse transcriptase/maturase family protein n=1 Tax=uncultured Halomonas sp. TaxID=173971 RepID=UPI00262CCD55|nr:reverse transcriptase/maturase family protein [uncultured Halomonas sp.]
MFSRIISEENFADAYRKTQRGRPKFSPGAIRFSSNETQNLEILRRQVSSGSYQPQEYVCFSVFEPKERIIYAPQYRDKIVQHAVNNVLRDFYEPRFIHDSYACIRGKGNHRAVLAVQRHFRRAWLNYQTPWIVKADVQKFFYSLDRRVVKAIVRRKLTCPRTLALVDVIIDSSPHDMGLPLGNLTSQLLANVFMNELDQYIKRTLKVRHYVRYADDLVIATDGKAQAGDILACIRAFGRDVLRIVFPDRKCFIRPLRARDGVETLGYRITPTRIGLTSAARSRLLHRLRVFDRLLGSFRITPTEVVRSLTSWYSYASLASCQHFVERACWRTRHIRFAYQRFHARLPCSATT